MQYDISVNIAVSKERVSFNMRHYTATLGDVMAKNVFETFKNAITCVLDHAQSAVSDLELLCAHDKFQIHDWNSYDWEDVQVCVHYKVSEQVTLRPNAQAIHAWDGNLTYQDLNRLATSMAEHL